MVNYTQKWAYNYTRRQKLCMPTINLSWTGHVEAGHGEGADAMEAGCDNGMGHVGEGADTMEA